MLHILALLLPACLAGVVQGVSGFGAGIVMMMVYPYLMHITEAAFLCQMLGIFLCLTMLARYIRHVNWKLLPLPLLTYFPVYLLLLSVAARTDISALRPVLGGVMILLSLYFLFVQKNLTMRPVWYNAMICASLSAFLDSFFGIGGPPIVLYFLAVTRGKDEYLGTLQGYFICTSLFGTVMRISKGMVPADPLLAAAMGLLGLLAGLVIAGRIVQRINGDTVKRIVYYVIGLSGITTLISSIL